MNSRLTRFGPKPVLPLKPYVGILPVILPVAAFACRQLFAFDYLMPQTTVRFTLSKGATIELAKVLFPDRQDGGKRHNVFEAFAEEMSLMAAIPFCADHSPEYLLSKLASPQGNVLSAVVADLGEMGTAVPSACDLVCEIKPDQLRRVLYIIEVHAGNRNFPPGVAQKLVYAMRAVSKTRFPKPVA